MKNWSAAVRQISTVMQYHLFSLRYDIPMIYATVQLKPVQPHFDLYSATGF